MNKNSRLEGIFHNLGQKDLFYIVMLICIVSVAFIYLFYPHLRTFITPDVANSDQIHLNYSIKQILANALKNNSLPWWEAKVANGYPLIGESQVGVFYIPNLIFLKFLPFEVGFNLGYVFCFIICSIGSYLFLIQHIKNKLLASIGSLYFTFSAPLFMQITHYNTLQAYTLIPLILYCIEKFITSRYKLRWFLLATLIYSQQFFAGYLQTNFILSVILFFYLVLTLYFNEKKDILRKILYSSSIVFLMNFCIVFLTAIQLAPLIEFSLQSTRKGGIGINSLTNSLPFFSLLTYFNFHSLGVLSGQNPQVHTFTSIRNLLWETNLYTGIIPLLFLATSLYWLKKNIRLQVFYILILLCLLLALGLNSPTYIIFLLPVFNFFRTPARYIIFLNFFIIATFVISVHSVEKVFSKINLVKFIFILFVAIDIYKLNYFLREYHPTALFSEIRQSETAKNINRVEVSKNDYHIYQVGNELIWSSTMFKEGWKNPKKYLFLLNDLNPYFNTVFNISSANLFWGSSYYPLPFYLYDELIKSQIYDTSFDEEEQMKLLSPTNTNSNVMLLYEKKISLNQTFIQLLRLKNVKYIISPFTFIQTNDIKKVYTAKKNFEIPYSLYVYAISNSRPRYYFAKSIIVADDANTFLRKVKSVQDQTVFMTTKQRKNIKIDESINIAEAYTWQKVQEKSTAKTLHVSTPTTSLFIDTDSFYSGWKAYVDQKEVPILPVNITQRGIVIPKGSHTVDFLYKPSWYYPALWTTALSHLILFTLLVYSFAAKDYPAISGIYHEVQHFFHRKRK